MTVQAKTLDYLAPDKDVSAQKGYKQNPNTNGPTMKQKVKYVLSNRKVQSGIIKTVEDAAQIVDDSIGTFIRSVYTRASISTHTPTEKSEVKRIYDLVKVVLSELLELRI